MGYSRVKLILGVAVIVSLSFPMTVYAATKLNIKPKMSVQWQVDSNLYLAQDREREVYTYILQPGIELGIETAKSNLMLDYTLDAFYYDDRDTVLPGEDPSDDDNYVGHTGIIEAKHRPFDRLHLILNESFYLTRDPAQADEFSNSVDRDKYYVNRFTPIVIYEFGRKFTAGLRYRHTKIDYSSSNNEDSNENRGKFDLVYNFTPKTSLDLEYQYWRKNYDFNTSDYDSNQIQLIFRKRFRTFNVSAGAGYQNRSFDDSSLDDLNVVTYHLKFNGEGTLANRRTNISLNIEQNFNDQSVGSNYYTATRFIVSGGHEFSGKLSGDVTAYYQLSDYERSKRKDDTYEITGNITYMLARWLSLSVGAGYEKRESNLEGSDYKNTFFISRLEFTYDLGRKRH
jgi:hypothetical protein